MTIYIAGTGPFNMSLPLNGAVSIVASGSVDTTYVNAGVLISNSTIRALTKRFVAAAGTDLWLHFEMSFSGTPTAGCVMCSLASDTSEWVRVMGLSGGNMQLQYWDGSIGVGSAPNFQPVGTSFSVPLGRTQYDLHLNAKAGGTLDFYINKVLVATLASTTDLSVIGTINYAGFSCPRVTTGDSALVSQILVTDFNTINAKVAVTAPTTLGTNVDWAGPVSQINETVPDTSSAITTATDGAIETLTAAARSFTGMSVAGLIVQFNANLGAQSSLVHAAGVLRVGSTNYAGTTQTVGSGIGEYSAQFINDPSTGAPWLLAAATSATLEFGVKATT